jgi:hypothetical protein
MSEEFVSVIQVGPDANSLEFLQACYRCPLLPLTTRMRAAIAALPHEAPRLSVQAMISNQQDYAAIFDERHKRAKANGMYAKVIEQAQPSPRIIEHQPSSSGQHRRRV